jgi:hypothetical protein
MAAVTNVKMSLTKRRERIKIIGGEGSPDDDVVNQVV